MSDFYYNGFKTQERGDHITVWRGDLCVGWVQCGLDGRFAWSVNIGQHVERGICEDYATAKNTQAAATIAFLNAQGLMLVRNESYSPKPTAPFDPAADLWAMASSPTYKTAEELRSFMNGPRALRYLSELEKDARVALSRRIRQHIYELENKEDAA